MSTSARGQGRPELVRLPFYYGWINLVVAALAMVCTLPGRTHGLGLVTEPLLKDLSVDRVTYAQINLWATLIGAAFCLPAGRLIDRYGARVVLVCVSVGLGLAVLGLSALSQPGATRAAEVLAGWRLDIGAATLLTSALFVTITLTRGFGQSALSVVSLSIVGKWFSRRLGLAMGVYSLLMGFGFAGAFRGVGWLLSHPLVSGWRPVWDGMGWFLLVGLTLLGLLVRPTPEQYGLVVDGVPAPAGLPAEKPSGFTLGQALRTPAFWVFALAASFYSLASSGISLFNQAILEEIGFDRLAYYKLLTLTTLVGLATNFLGGWLAGRFPIGLVLGAAMTVMALSLFALPSLNTYPQLVLYGVSWGAAGGVVTVVFFTFWGHAFGRLHLGNIQALAQILTVLASALGPLLLAECRQRALSYMPAFYGLAPVAAILGLAAWWVPIPKASEADAARAASTSDFKEGVLLHADND
jgi:MFS family permease